MQARSSGWHHCLVVEGSLFLLLTLLLTACGAATTITPAKPRQTIVSHVDDFLTTEVQDMGFSGSVLIARGGKVLFSKGYSMADWDLHLPNTPHTKFYIGSLTKQFTAMAILILQEQGKLHVQDHLCSYLSDCLKAWQPITIHHLLTHTSGFPTLPGNPFTTMPSTPQQAVEEVVALYKNKPLDFAPGTQFSYSNEGYGALGYIIQKVSGQPYALFLQHTIFDPLQMRDTGYVPNYASLPDHATGYQTWQVKADPALLPFPQNLTFLPYPLNLSFLVAGGALYSTVADLYRWDQALSTETLVSKKSLDEMFTPYVPYVAACITEDCAASYGYGWFISRGFVFHGGIAPGFQSYNGLYRQNNVDIIVLSNLRSLDSLKLVSNLERDAFARP